MVVSPFLQSLAYPHLTANCAAEKGSEPLSNDARAPKGAAETHTYPPSCGWASVDNMDLPQSCNREGIRWVSFLKRKGSGMWVFKHFLSSRIFYYSVLLPLPQKKKVPGTVHRLMRITGVWRRVRPFFPPSLIKVHVTEKAAKIFFTCNRKSPKLIFLFFFFFWIIKNPLND